MSTHAYQLHSNTYTVTRVPHIVTQQHVHNDTRTFQVQHKLDMIKFSELWKEEDTRIEFWLSTNQAFQQKTMSPDLAANFFEVRVTTHSE